MKTGSLVRRRFYACDVDGVPSWSCKVYARHKAVRLQDIKGVVEVILGNNKRLCLDRISKPKREDGKIHYSGFLETEEPTNNFLACFREEWEFVDAS